MGHAQEAEKVASHVEAEALIKQWITTENLISKEATEWKVKKNHFANLSEIFSEQVKVLDADLEAAQWEDSDFEKETESLKLSISSSEDARKATISFMQSAVPKVIELTKAFPEPLKKELELDIELLGEDVTNTNVREVLRTVIKVLQSSERFNRAFNFYKQVLEIEGEQYQAQVIYLGLSSAFFKAGKKYGIGKPSKDGWNFEEKPELSTDIEKGFAVHEGSVPSALFKLPLEVKGGE